MPEANEIYWSDNEEDWRAESLCELLNGNDNLKAGDSVWFGKAIAPSPLAFISADRIVEQMGEMAYEEYGEHADDYPIVVAAAKDALDAFLSKWVTDNCPAHFFRITEVTEHILTAEEVS
jgi:hypothetical protein